MTVGRPFEKGDIRINRKGRPKSFDQARALAQQLSHEIVKIKDENGNEVPLVIDGRAVTVVEAILRSWAASGDSKLSIAFVEYAFGRVPAVTEVTGKGGRPIEIDHTPITDDERAARLAAILDAAKSRRAQADE